MQDNILTPRELEVLYWAKQGYAHKQSARKLGVKEQTVKTYSSHIMNKTGAINIAHAVFLSLKYQWIDFSVADEQNQAFIGRFI